MRRGAIIRIGLLAGAVLLAWPGYLWWVAGEAPRDDGIRFEQGPSIQRAYDERFGADPSAQPALEAPPAAPDVPTRETPAPPPGPIDELVMLLVDHRGDPVPARDARLSVLPGDLQGRAWVAALANDLWLSLVPDGGAVFGARSDAHGQLHFQGVPRHRRVRIDVPAHGPHAHAVLLTSTQTERRSTIRLQEAASALTLRVLGLPPHPGNALVLLRPPWARRFGDSVPRRVWAHCIEALDDQGVCITPKLPAGPLAACVFVPGVGWWDEIPVDRQGEGQARVVLPPGDTATLRGQLLDAKGQGVPGARLTISVGPFLDTGYRPSWVRPARSDAAGRFIFESLPAGMVHELHIEAPGFVTPRGMLEDAPLRPGEDLDIRLQLVRACAAAGRVVDAEGRPVVGARVRAHHQRGGMRLWAPGASWTDEQGRWRMEGLMPGPCEFEATAASHPGRVRTKAEVEAGALTQVPVLRVAAGVNRGRVHVTVIDGAGDPVGGATVTYRVRHGNTSGQVQAGPTLPDGTYEIEGIQSQLESFEVWASWVGAVSTAYPVEVAEVHARTARVRVALPLVGRIDGRVMEGGKAASGISVRVEGTRLKAQTDHEGRFHIRGVPPGPQELRLRLPSGADVGEATAVVVLADETVNVVIPFERPPQALSLRGRLLDGAGRPWPGVTLHAHGSGGRKLAGSARTRPDGSFSIEVERRDSYSIRARKRILAAGRSPDEPPADVVFDPASLPIVEGYLVGPAGRPTLGGNVEVVQFDSGREPESDASGGYFRMALKAGQVEGLQVKLPHGYLDADGHHVQAPEVRVPFKVGDSLELRAAAPRETQDAVAAARLFGFVVREDGTPLPGVLLWRVEGNRQSSLVRSRAPDGHFEVRGVPETPFHVTITAPPGFRSSKVSRLVHGADGPLRITVPRVSPDEVFQGVVTVVDLDGVPVAGVPLTTRDLEIGAEATTDERGQGTLPFLARKQHSVSPAWRWEPTGYEGNVGHPHVTLSPESPEATMRLPIRKRDRTNEHDVWFHIHDPEGAVLDGGEPRIRMQGLGDRENVRFRPQRSAFGRTSERARIADVPAGRYRVEIQFDGFDPPYLPIKPFEIEVPVAPIDVTLRRSAQLHGRVALVGEKQHEITVWEDGGGRWMRKIVASTGLFTFNVDPEQTLDVIVRSDGSDAYAALTGVRARDAPLAIKLDKPGLVVHGRLKGMLRLPQGYDLTLSGRVSTSVRIKKDGTFRVGGLPPGAYTLSFETEDLAAFGAGEDGPIFLTARAEAKAGGPAVELAPK